MPTEKCDLCIRDVSAGEGFLLSTSQVLTEPRYWEAFFRQHFRNQIHAIGENGEKLASFVLLKAADDSAWRVCESCISLFHINKEEARELLRRWREAGDSVVDPQNIDGMLLRRWREISWLGTCPDEGALDAAKRGWKAVFGREPRIDPDDASLPAAIAMYTIKRGRETRGRSWWRFGRRKPGR